MYQCSYYYNVTTATHFGSVIKRTPSISFKRLSRTVRARGGVSGVGVTIVERNGTERRIDGLQVGVVNDVIPLFGGQTRASSQVHKNIAATVKTPPQMSDNLGKSCPIVLPASAATKTSCR